MADDTDFDTKSNTEKDLVEAITKGVDQAVSGLVKLFEYKLTETFQNFQLTTSSRSFLSCSSNCSSPINEKNDDITPQEKAKLSQIIKNSVYKPTKQAKERNAEYNFSIGEHSQPPICLQNTSDSLEQEWSPQSINIEINITDEPIPNQDRMRANPYIALQKQLQMISHSSMNSKIKNIDLMASNKQKSFKETQITSRPVKVNMIDKHRKKFVNSELLLNDEQRRSCDTSKSLSKSQKLASKKKCYCQGYLVDTNQRAQLKNKRRNYDINRDFQLEINKNAKRDTISKESKARAKYAKEACSDSQSSLSNTYFKRNKRTQLENLVTHLQEIKNTLKQYLRNAKQIQSPNKINSSFDEMTDNINKTNPYMANVVPIEKTISKSIQKNETMKSENSQISIDDVNNNQLLIENLIQKRSNSTQTSRNQHMCLSLTNENAQHLHDKTFNFCVITDLDRMQKNDARMGSTRQKENILEPTYIQIDVIKYKCVDEFSNVQQVVQLPSIVIVEEEQSHWESSNQY